jgi:cytochrome d ubiquinol oxidase subunit I
MHTPAGHALVDGRFHPADWWQVIFNPSFPYRLVHMVLAAYLTTAFVVGAVGAWHLLRRQGGEEARVMFSMALWMAALVVPLQIVAGDLHGLNTLEHQPAKIAAIEGHWETQEGAPFILVGWPDMDAEETRWKVEIPHLGSFILTHDWQGEVPGLKDWAPEDRPNATVIFWTFRVMVALGFAMFGLGLLSLWLRLKRRLYEASWFHRLALLMGPSGFVAILCGWVTTEMGRQPWVVHGLLRTADAVSPVSGGEVAASLALFVVVYLVVFGTGFAFVLRLMAKGPEAPPPAQEPAEPATGSQRPMAAAGEPGG